MSAEPARGDAGGRGGPPLGTLLLVTGAGALGLLPGAAGAADPVALLAWLALIAPAAGYASGVHGVRAWPFGAAVPGVWAGLVAWADARSARDLPGPLWAIAAVAGLFLLGLAVGAARATRVTPGTRGERAVRAAPGVGALLGLALVLSGLPVQGGLGAGTSWARDDAARPAAAAARRAAARLALDLSPLVLVLECAGWDWTHAHPTAYRVSGVEWFPRRPWRGRLAGPVLLLVGCTAVGIASVVRRRRFRPTPT